MLGKTSRALVDAIKTSVREGIAVVESEERTRVPRFSAKTVEMLVGLIV